MNTKPIPRNILIHSIKYKEVLNGDGWDNAYADPIKINNVRVNPSKSVSRSSEAVSTDVSHIVFVDRMFSSYFPDFVEKSIIEWNNKEYEINKVNPYYDTKELPHHYELELR